MFWAPPFFKNSNTVDNRLQHDFQSYAWELHAPTLIFFFMGSWWTRMHPFGVNCLRASADKAEQLNWDLKF